MTSTTEIDQELAAVLEAITQHETALRNLREQQVRIEQSFYGLQGAKETLTRLKERIESSQAAVEAVPQTNEQNQQ